MNLPLIPTNILQEIEKNGFVGPYQTGIPHETLARAADYVDRVLRERPPNPLYDRFSVRDYHLLEPHVLDLLACDPVVECVSRILGENLLLWRSKIFCKPPGEGPLGWHQEWGEFNGEEIGNNRPALLPSENIADRPWNLTVWLALDTVEADMGPIRFACGSHHRRYPVTMKPIIQSEFYLDPFIEIESPRELAKLARENALVLDINTANYFDNIDPGSMTLAQAREHVVRCLQAEKGAVTLDFDESEHDIVSLPMPAGSFVVFYERTMHGSSANNSKRRRLGINARFTPSETTVYPFRNDLYPIDGSNLNIRKHASVLVSGANLNPVNNVITLQDLKACLVD